VWNERGGGESSEIRRTVAGKEEERCGGVEIGHGDVGGP